MSTRPRRAVNGEISTTGTPMKYAHGQHAAYVLDRCRCTPCGRANTEYEYQRSRSMVPAFIDAQPARDHLAWLATQGVGLKTVAKVSGVAQGTLWKLVYGKNGRPSERVRPRTSEAILAVGLEHRAGGSRVPAGVTWQLLDEMITAGVPRVRLAEAIGNRGGLQVSRDLVTMETARKLAEIYEGWHAGEVLFERRDSYGRSVVVRPAAAKVKQLLPAGVKPDMRKLRQLKVVAGGELHNPGRHNPSRPDPSHVDEPVQLLAPVRGPWRARARCLDAEPWVFFPTIDDEVAIAKAKKWCNSCPVRPECLDAHRYEPAGIFGGLTEEERHQLPRDLQHAAAACS